MTAAQALKLSVAHNLGTARNTLAPGVELPAFTTGMDPTQWYNRVQAMAMSRLQPAGFETSQFKFENVPGSFDIGSSAPGSSKIMVRKSPQEAEQAIQLLMSALAPASTGGGPGSEFADGRWLFGNDFGGLQSAFLTSAQLDESARSNRVRESLQANQQANQFALQREQLASQAAHSNLQDQIAVMDYMNRLGQLSFEDQVQLYKLKGAAADTEFGNNLGISVVDAQGGASRGLTASQNAYNNRVLQIAQNYGFEVKDNNGALTLLPDKTADPKKVIEAQAELYNSPENAALTSAHDAVLSAQIAAAKAPYQTRPSAGMSVPTLPAFRFNGVPTVTTPTVPQGRTALPYSYTPLANGVLRLPSGATVRITR